MAANFETVINEYLTAGVKRSNIDLAIELVKKGTKRDHIIENLTEDYNGMDEFEATQMVSDLYEVSGTEFKQENRAGLLFGVLALALGLAATAYIIVVFTQGGVLVAPAVVVLVAIVGTLLGIFSLVKGLFGKHKNDIFDEFRD